MEFEVGDVVLINGKHITKVTGEAGYGMYIAIENYVNDEGETIVAVMPSCMIKLEGKVADKLRLLWNLK